MFQILLLAFDILFQSPHSYKSCENRPVWGADNFQPFGNQAKGLFCLEKKICGKLSMGNYIIFCDKILTKYIKLKD